MNQDDIRQQIAKLVDQYAAIEFSQKTFGPNEQDVKPVDWILDKMISKWPNSSWELDQNSNLHEAGFLKLDITKAESKLGWQPVWELSHTLEKIISWHRAWLNKEDMQAICLAEIEEYTRDMNK